MQMKNGSLMQQESGDPMPLTFFHNNAIKGAGERQPAQGMRYGEFPERHGAEKNLIGRIGEDLTRRRRQVFRPCDDPQKRTGIEEALHP